MNSGCDIIGNIFGVACLRIQDVRGVEGRWKRNRAFLGNEQQPFTVGQILASRYFQVVRSENVCQFRHLRGIRHFRTENRHLRNDSLFDLQYHRRSFNRERCRGQRFGPFQFAPEMRRSRKVSKPKVASAGGLRELRPYNGIQPFFGGALVLCINHEIEVEAVRYYYPILFREEIVQSKNHWLRLHGFHRPQRTLPRASGSCHKHNPEWLSCNSILVNSGIGTLVTVVPLPDESENAKTDRHAALVNSLYSRLSDARSRIRVSRKRYWFFRLLNLQVISWR